MANFCDSFKIELFSESSLFRNDVLFSNSKWSYLSLLQAWHLQPVCLSLADLLTQTQHLRQTPRLQSIHSSLRLKSKENPSPQRAQIRWLNDFCFDMRVSISCLLWAVSKSASTCLEKYNWYCTFHLKKKKIQAPKYHEVFEWGAVHKWRHTFFEIFVPSHPLVTPFISPFGRSPSP